MKSSKGILIILTLIFLIFALFIGKVYEIGLTRPPLQYAHIPDYTQNFIRDYGQQKGVNIKVADVGPFDWENEEDLGQKEWDTEEDNNFIVYYKHDNEAIWQGYAQNVLESARGNVEYLKDLFGKYYYAEDVNGRRLAIYLPCNKDLYDNTIASLMGQDTYNAAGTAGMIITRVGPLGCLTKGIVLNPICFEKGNIFTANHYDRVLKHEMAHYVFLTSLNYGNNVSHYNWVVEGIAEYFSFNREYVVTGKDSLDFMNRNCKLNGNFPIERNSAYWGGESFFSYLEKISGKNGVKQFIQNTYEMPTDSVFKKGNMNIESLHQNWIAGQNTLTETDSIH